MFRHKEVTELFHVKSTRKMQISTWPSQIFLKFGMLIELANINLEQFFVYFYHLRFLNYKCSKLTKSAFFGTSANFDFVITLVLFKLEQSEWSHFLSYYLGFNLIPNMTALKILLISQKFFEILNITVFKKLYF